MQEEDAKEYAKSFRRASDDADKRSRPNHTNREGAFNAPVLFLIMSGKDGNVLRAHVAYYVSESNEEYEFEDRVAKGAIPVENVAIVRNQANSDIKKIVEKSVVMLDTQNEKESYVYESYGIDSSKIPSIVVEGNDDENDDEKVLKKAYLEFIYNFFSYLSNGE